MYKTKGVEPNSKDEMNKGTSNALEVLTQYNL